MPTSIEIDFCPTSPAPGARSVWRRCYQALVRCQDVVQPTLRFQPFDEPGMPPGGEDIGEHLARKYGSSPAQQAQIRRHRRARRGGGFAFHPDGRGRIVNTFNAHACCTGRASRARRRSWRSSRALLQAYHGHAERVDHDAVLLVCVRQAGLDEARAARILTGDEFAAEVRGGRAPVGRRASSRCRR